MDLWMYLVVIGMFLVATVGTVWITLWTIQRGEARRKAAEAAAANAPDGAASAAPVRPVRTVSTRTISTATAKTTTESESEAG